MKRYIGEEEWPHLQKATATVARLLHVIGTSSPALSRGLTNAMLYDRVEHFFRHYKAS
jgi:hypothetical protein